MAVAAPHELLLARSPVAILLASVTDWWAGRATEAGLAPEWRDWRRALPAPPVGLPPASEVSLSEADPFALGNAYVEALDPSTRLREGRHYTPRLLAEALWEELQAEDVTGGRVVDPACGAGALLVPALREFAGKATDPVRALAHVREQFGGTDLDPVAVWLGNAVLGAELLPLWGLVPEHERRPLPQLLRVGDGLDPTGDRPSVVVMNPPYGRLRLSAADRLRWHDTLYGHANRYALFLHAAVERVREDGVVAAIIPTSFLGGAYYQRLRAFLAREAPLTRLAFVDSRAGVFAGDVLQETCLAVFRRRARPRSVACTQIHVNHSVRRTGLPEVSSPNGAAAKPWLLPRRPADGALIEAAGRLPARLADYGWKAQTGPLVWNRHKVQISATRADGALPIVWAADLNGGTVRRDVARDRRRWIVLRSQDAFMRLSQPAILVQRTTAPEQQRRIVAGALDAETLAEWGGAVVVENHVNVLRCDRQDSPLTPRLLLALLRTETFDRLYRCLTGSVAVSAYELDALPFADAQTLRKWDRLYGDRLAAVVRTFYGDDPS